MKFSPKTDKKKREHNRGEPHWIKNGGGGGNSGGTRARNGKGGNKSERGGRCAIAAGCGRGGGARWCLSYNTMRHSDEECLKPKAITAPAIFTDVLSPSYRLTQLWKLHHKQSGATSDDICVWQSQRPTWSSMRG